MTWDESGKRERLFEGLFFTARLKKSCKYTHVNEIKHCAGTQAKCI